MANDHQYLRFASVRAEAHGKRRVKTLPRRKLPVVALGLTHITKETCCCNDEKPPLDDTTTHPELATLTHWPWHSCIWVFSRGAPPISPCECQYWSYSIDLCHIDDILLSACLLLYCLISGSAASVRRGLRRLAGPGKNPVDGGWTQTFWLAFGDVSNIKLKNKSAFTITHFN